MRPEVQRRAVSSAFEGKRGAICFQNWARPREDCEIPGATGYAKFGLYANWTIFDVPVADDDEAVTLRGDNQCFDATDRNRIKLATRLESVADDDHEGAWNSTPGGKLHYVGKAVFDRVKTQELFLLVFVQHIVGEFGGNTLQGEARELFANVVVPIMATARTTFAVAVSRETCTFILHLGQ